MWAVELLDELRVREVFGVDRAGLDAPDFPSSETDTTGAQRWPADRVWAWMATRRPGSAQVVPLRFWPRGDAVYRGAREVAGAVVQDWSIHEVTLRICWPTVPAFASGGVAGEVVSLTPRVARVIKVGYDFGMRGPSLSVHDSSGARVDAPETVWPELALVLGGRGPFWPYELRDRGAMLRWRPGDAPVSVEAVTVEPDPRPLLASAESFPADHSAHIALSATAAAARYRANQEAAGTVAMITDDPRRAPWIEMAVMPVSEPEPAEPNEVVRRDGWLAVAASTSATAHRALSAVLASGPTTDLPYTSAEYIDPASAIGAEWAARLRPWHRCAGFQVLDNHLTADRGDTVLEHLIDPATDAPVLRLSSGLLLAAVPHRLPTTSPLAAVVLDTPIWVRLADATVHLAPCRDTPGISWGYQGSGPTALALLIARLLDDITAPAADRLHGNEVGLEQLLSTAWPAATVLARSELETARARQ